MIPIEENKQTIINLLESTNRPDMDKLICKLKASDFFTTPASTKFHLNVPGGLAQHSLNVYRTFTFICKVAHAKVSQESMIVSGLLHDVCKVGLYIPAGDGYRYNKSQPDGHGDLSVRRIKHFIALSDQEEMLIRWHMNQYDDDFKNNKQMLEKVYPEVFLIYFADHISTLFLED